MTHPIHLIGDIYCLPIPEGAAEIEICNYGLNDALEFTHKIDGISAYDCADLPPGNWEIICTTKECTEEQAKGIVQIISNGKITGQPQYRRYDRDMVKDTPARCWTRDPRHALETLVASKGLDPDKTLIIKKVS